MVRYKQSGSRRGSSVVGRSRRTEGGGGGGGGGGVVRGPATATLSRDLPVRRTKRRMRPGTYFIANQKEVWCL